MYPGIILVMLMCQWRSAKIKVIYCHIGYFNSKVQLYS